LYAYGDKKAEGKQMNKNFWGEPDDIEPLPEWMDPKTYQNNNKQQRKPSKSLNEAIEEALRKPAVPLNIEEPKL
jgi:hypothetical protein